MNKNIIFVFVLSFFTFNAEADVAHIVLNSSDMVGINKDNIEYIRDYDNKFTIQDIQSGIAGKFSPIEKLNYGFGFKGSIWLRMNFDLESYKYNEVYLFQKYVHAISFEIYTNDGNNEYSQIETEHTLLKDRLYKFNEFLLEFPSSHKNNQIVYVKVDPGIHALSLEFEAANKFAAIRNIFEKLIPLGLFFGALGVLWLYNFVIALYLRSKVYFFYLYYLGSFALAMWYLNGLGPLLVGVNSHIDKFYTTMAFTTFHGLLLFTRSILELKNWELKISYVLEIILLVALVMMLVFNANGFIFLDPVIILTLFYVCVVSVNKATFNFKFFPFDNSSNVSKRIPILFTIGWSSFVVTGIAYVLKSYGVIESLPLGKYGFMASSVWEAVFFALTLAYNFKLLEEKNAEEKRKATESKNSLNKSLRSFDQFKMDLGQELHDELGQRIVALKIGAEILKEHPSAEKVIDVSRDMARIIQDAQNSIDHIIEGMWPPELESLGFDKAARSIASNYQPLYPDTAFVFDIEPDIERRIEASLKITLYRIIQEGITNILKHAHACNVTVNIRIMPNLDKKADVNVAYLVEVTIKDDGIGFDPGKIRFGQGISGIRRRLELLNGNLRIDTAIGKGTILIITMPCESDSCNKQD